MALLRLDRWSCFRTLVTESAYRRFCTVMMRNIEDCYHQRAFAGGRPGKRLSVAEPTRDRAELRR